MYFACFYQRDLFDSYDNDEILVEEDSETLDVENIIQGSLENRSSSSAEKENRRFYSYGSEIAKVLNVIKCEYSYSEVQFDWTITGKYNRYDKEHLMTWTIDREIDGNCHKLLVSKNDCTPISFNGDYLGSYLLPNDDLIVIATKCVVIFTLVNNEIQIIYYAGIILFENILQQHPKFQRRLKQYSSHERNGVIKMPKSTFTPENLWDDGYFKHVLDFIDEETDPNIVQHLGKMITMYLDDIYTFSQFSPYIVKSIVKSNDEKRKYRKHDNEMIGLIIDKCISYYNEDNSQFEVLCAITSSISELQKLYPYYVAQFFVCNSIFSHADETINYVPYPHLAGDIDELPEPHVTKFLRNVYGYICNYFNVIIIGIIGLILLLYIGILTAILSGVRTDTFKLFVIVGTFFVTGPIICVILFIILWQSIRNKLDERKIFYPAVKLLVPLPKFATYPTEYNFFAELLKPASNEFVKTTKIPIIYSDWNGEALLNFKWNRFAKYYYYVIWIVYTIFLLTFTLASSQPFNKISLENQKTLFYCSVILGFLQLTIEIRQFIWDWKGYIVSTWNWFAFIVFSYAHAFFLLLHPAEKFNPSKPVYDNDANNPWNLAYTYNPINNGTIIMSPSLILPPNLNTNLYEHFGTSLLAVYKLMTGDTSSLSSWEYRNSIALVFLWITFSLFTVIYLLNLFIGLLNIAIASNNSRVLFLLLRAELIAEIELFYLLPHQRRWDFWFPKRIFYHAHVNKLKNKIYNINDTYEDSRYKPNIQTYLLELLHIDANELNLTKQNIQKIDKYTQTDN
ncbi:23191_t:CDS:2 [Cetraspora pellucida]|uniref:23191_t:CDS:1 n=1 Tax=Cetraspora pellucida TaxID=1433469 RepID=A0A9N9NC38_9GLOM|nr:23191_t:CDS:2 [Cetraspora pellucida]